jgi:UDP-N-acetylmuramyl pentapeptide phosphotransferase/UDP-N-acetylglucosamine-1-phosphate transferase
MTLFGFGFYGVAAAWAGDAPFALLCLSVAGAALGFLFFNLWSTLMSRSRVARCAGN